MIGWPISVTADRPLCPFPPAERRTRRPACFPGRVSPNRPTRARSPTSSTRRRGRRCGAGTLLLCTNLLTGAPGGEAPAANLGTLVPNAELTEAEFRPGAVGARCDPRGFLLIGATDALPAMAPMPCPATITTSTITLSSGQHPRRRLAPAGGVRGGEAGAWRAQALAARRQGAGLAVAAR